MFLGKVVLKICSKGTGEHPCRSVTLLKLQFGMGVLLYICCIISEHLFLKTPLKRVLLKVAGCAFIKISRVSFFLSYFIILRTSKIRKREKYRTEKLKPSQPFPNLLGQASINNLKSLTDILRDLQSTYEPHLNSIALILKSNCF